jgi:ADP-ribose pyrophosphatase
MTRKIEVLRRDVGFDGFFRLERIALRHSLQAGGMSPPLTRERLITADVAAVLPFDPRRDELVLIEQFRVGALERGEGAWLLEIVAGRIEAGEDPESVARRETVEETGCAVERLLPMASFYTSPHRATETTHLYCGIVDATTAHEAAGLAHEGEDIRVLRVAVAEALSRLRNGQVDSAWLLIALQWLALNRDGVRATGG